MTISNQPSRKPSDSGAARSFRIPSRPSASSASEQTQASQSKTGSLVASRELPELGTLPLSASDAFHSEYASLAPIAPLTAKKRRGPLVALLGVVTVLVVLGGLLGQHLLSATNGSSNQGVLNFPSNGPYASVPLSPDQISAIMHLPEHMKDKALASLYVSHLSLSDEIGQLIMLEYSSTNYTGDLDYAINTLHVGGVIMYEFQMNTLSQTKSDIAHMQTRANLPLLISTDEEGGPYVHRLKNIYGLRMSPTQIFESGDVNVATQQGLKVSQQLAALGINEDLTPDVDTNQVNGYDMISRTFGNTPAEVIKFAGAYIQAMQGNGTIGCIKHYPGLGGASPDAHKVLPVVNSSKQQIYDLDLAPFKAFIQSPDTMLNPGMIMPTDVLMPAIDPKYPAELSHIFMTDILRNQFHYDGVVLTDALYMQGITDTWSMDTAAVMALQAGDDMLLGANDTGQTLSMINAIKHALADGQLSKARIDEAATRIIALKMQYHLMPASMPNLYA
jgi:beta-N-acetylhexosaminidase